MNEFEKQQGCVKAIFEYRYAVREYTELNETGLGAVGNFTLLKAVKEDRFSRKQ